jgi:ubiquinone/menaquinone biosynthesis C-methylase UbiE
MCNVFAVPVIGGVGARIMAHSNREAEREAIEVLAPGPRDAVLVLGFGAGVGIELLAAAVPHGWIAGADPARPMVRAAARRNRAAVARGQVHLSAAPAADLPWGTATFDGALAVNSIQMWEPLDRSLAEVARVLRPGAQLVTLTHDWALRHGHASVEAWWAATAPRIAAAGFTATERWTARAEDGTAVGLTATR